ncbi:hypothetical protein RYX36_001798 [Vicia faba]
MDAEESLSKVDSFSRWMSTAFASVDDLHMQSSLGIPWGTDECGNMIDDTSLNLSLSQDQLFSIHDFSPRWAYAELEIQVFIIGTVLKSKPNVETCNWSCMFGEVEVPATVLANGILCCQAPPLEIGLIPFHKSKTEHVPYADKQPNPGTGLGKVVLNARGSLPAKASRKDVRKYDDFGLPIDDDDSLLVPEKKEVSSVLKVNEQKYHDSKVLEHASVCLTRIAEAFASSSDKLDELCNHGLVTQAASLISNNSSGGGQASLSTPTYTGLIRLLSTCASGSPLGAKTLLLLGISGVLKDILSGSGVSSNTYVSPALSRPPEQIFEIVNLENELLPPLPQGTISLPTNTNFVKGPVIKKSPAGSSAQQEDTNGNPPEISAREKLLNEQPELLKQFGMDLLPVLIQIYGSSVNIPVRHKCLSAIGKLMYFSPSEMIQSLLSMTNISSFLSGVLASKDPHVLTPALQIAEILMEKLPETFSKMFIREGIIHAVDLLILPGNSTNVSTQASTAEKDTDSLPGASSRVRRNWRRSGKSNPDGNPLDDIKSPVSVNVGSPPSSGNIPTVNSSIRLSVSAAAKTFKDHTFLRILGLLKWVLQMIFCI